MTTAQTEARAIDALVAEMRAGLEGVTPGPWSVFIDDSGDQWTGWPLSINCDTIDDKTVVRPGGQWPYEWDAKTSQHEACKNAAHIARCSPDNIRALLDHVDALQAQVERLTAINANLMGDDENVPRYTTRRMKQEARNRTEFLELEVERLTREREEVQRRLQQADEGLANAYSSSYSDYDRDRLACERNGLQRAVGIVEHAQLAALKKEEGR